MIKLMMSTNPNNTVRLPDENNQIYVNIPFNTNFIIYITTPISTEIDQHIDGILTPIGRSKHPLEKN